MPPLDPMQMAMQQYLMGNGVSMDPYTAQLLMSLVMPNLNKYGEPEVYDVDAQAKGLNQLQNIYSSLADPMNAVMAGPGSFGMSPLGGGILGGGGLDPITTEEVMETPATLQTRYQAQAFESGQPGTRSLEGLVASKLISGQDPSLIVTDLQAKLANPQAAGLDPTEAVLFQNSLPQRDVLGPSGEPTGETTIDWNATRKWVEDRATPYLQEQASLMGPNITQNQLGQYVTLSEKPSPQMEWLQKMGLPDPRSTYGTEFALQNSPEMAALAGNIASKGQAYEGARGAYEKFLRLNPMARQLEGQQRGRDQRYDADLKNAITDYGRDIGTYMRQSLFNRGPSEKELEDLAQQNAQATLSRQYATSFIPPPPIDPETGFSEPYASYNPPQPLPELRKGPAKPELKLPDRQNAMMRMLVGGNVRAAPFGASHDLFKMQYGAKKRAGEDMLAFARQLAPMVAANRAGRTPFGDAMMQRLQPIFAVGGAG